MCKSLKEGNFKAFFSINNFFEQKIKNENEITSIKEVKLINIFNNLKLPFISHQKILIQLSFLQKMKSNKIEFDLINNILVAKELNYFSYH